MGYLISQFSSCPRARRHSGVAAKIAVACRCPQELRQFQ